MGYDVIVLGLGALGSSTAYHLARRARRVLALERFGPVHDRGASHGESRCVFQSYFMGPRYVPLVRQALRMWTQAGEQAGETLVTRSGGLLLSSGSGVLAERAEASAVASDVPHEMLDGTEIQARFPQLKPGDDARALYDPIAGFLHPERAVRVHLNLAERAGATLCFHEVVLDWSASDTGVVVRTDKGSYSADQLVLCVGSWINQLLIDDPLPVRVLRKVQVWFEPVTGEAAFGAERFPFWCWDTGDSVAMGFPVVAPGAGVKSALHSGGETCDPDTVDRTIREQDLEHLGAFLRPRVPAIAGGKVLRGEVGLYDMSPDRHFIVGRLAGRDRVHVAAGTSGHAFKFAPVLGDALAESVCDGRSTHDIGMFDPARFTSRSR